MKRNRKEAKIDLFHGDCLAVMDNFKVKKAKCAIIDPPYKMTKRGKSCRPNWMADNMGDNVFEGELPNTSEWMRKLYNSLETNSHIYIFTNTISLQEYLNEAIKAGFKLHNIITMIKDTGMPNRWYYKQCELILFLRKGKAYPINDYTSRDNINVKMPKNKSGKFHITQKPTELIELLVSNSTKEGDTVIDIFMGSGTTGVVCKSLGRNFIGIELNDTYFNIAKGRINDKHFKIVKEPIDEQWLY